MQERYWWVHWRTTMASNQECHCEFDTPITLTMGCGRLISQCLSDKRVFLSTSTEHKCHSTGVHSTIG